MKLPTSLGAVWLSSCAILILLAPQRSAAQAASPGASRFAAARRRSPRRRSPACSQERRLQASPAPEEPRNLARGASPWNWSTPNLPQAPEGRRDFRIVASPLEVRSVPAPLRGSGMGWNPSLRPGARAPGYMPGLLRSPVSKVSARESVLAPVREQYFDRMVLGEVVQWEHYGISPNSNSRADGTAKSAVPPLTFRALGDRETVIEQQATLQKRERWRSHAA